jgi:hypothetical protein
MWKANDCQTISVQPIPKFRYQTKKITRAKIKGKAKPTKEKVYLNLTMSQMDFIFQLQPITCIIIN